MIKASDWVRCKTDGPGGTIGSVRRVARDGSWADVVWHALGHTKRMRTTAITVVTTISAPGGGTVTDMTRAAEILEEKP